MTSTVIQALAGLLGIVLTAALSTYVLGQQKVKISEKRLSAYGPLWALTKQVRRGGPPWTPAQRLALANALTDWYYTADQGMLATERVVAMFLKLRRNLVCAPEEFFPDSWQGLFEPLAHGETPDSRRHRLLADQFSLLRTQMKMDCAIYYGRHVSPNRVIDPYEVAFIHELGGKRSWAWRRQIWRSKKCTREEFLDTVLADD
jgi:hypothetical protein